MFKTVRFWAVTLGMLAVSSIGLMSGCSAVYQVQDYLGKAVTMYCAQPAGQRVGIRNAVNARTSPNVVRIDCSGDRTEPSPGPAEPRPEDR